MYSDGIRRKNQRDAIIAGCGETDLLTIDQAYEIAKRVEMFEQNSYRSQSQGKQQDKPTKKAHVNATNQEKESVGGVVGGVERGGGRGRGGARGGRVGQQQQQQQQ